MRWQRLFADLEGQLAAAEEAELAGEVRDRTRREYSRLRLHDRIAAALDTDLGVRLPVLGVVEGRLLAAGPDWLLLGEATGRETLVPLGRVLAVAGLGRRSIEPGSEGAVAARLDLRYPLRALARDRATVALVLADGSVPTGTIDRVGADFLELAEHPAAEPRRGSAVRRVVAVPLGALVAARTGG